MKKKRNFSIILTLCLSIILSNVNVYAWGMNTHYAAGKDAYVDSTNWISSGDIFADFGRMFLDDETGLSSDSATFANKVAEIAYRGYDQYKKDFAVGYKMHIRQDQNELTIRENMWNELVTTGLQKPTDAYARRYIMDVYVNQYRNANNLWSVYYDKELLDSTYQELGYANTTNLHTYANINDYDDAYAMSYFSTYEANEIKKLECWPAFSFTSAQANIASNYFIQIANSGKMTNYTTNLVADEPLQIQEVTDTSIIDNNIKETQLDKEKKINKAALKLSNDLLSKGIVKLEVKEVGEEQFNLNIIVVDQDKYAQELKKTILNLKTAE